MADPPDLARGAWVPPATPTTVAGYVIPSGLIYVGRHLPAQAAHAEPALINPDLPVAASAAKVADPGPASSLAYHLMSPAARAGYLQWLASGRITDVPTGLVRLFCFGLERRVLVDGDDPATRRELPAIIAEVRRLRARYSAGEPGFRVLLDRLLDLLDLLTAPRGAPSAPMRFARPGSAMAVRVALARFAAASAPVPIGWAQAWVAHHPSLNPRSAQARCPEEFGRLFALRYRERHGAGLVAADGVPGIRLKYQPANPGLTTTLVCREDLPDVLTEARGTRALRALVDTVATALDPYCRWLAKYPQGRGSLAAATVLPPELIDAGYGQLGALRVWAERKLDGKPLAVIDVAEFATFWPTASPDRMARDEAAAFLRVLAVLRLGVEPDVRFSGPALAPGPAVLFRLGGPATDRPSTRFAAAAAVVRCAVAVASASGPVDPRYAAGPAILATVRELALLLRVDPGEDVRIMARLAWLLVSGVDVDHLGRQTAQLDEAGREIAGRYLIGVAAAADPPLGPATVAMLIRVYRILGLAPDLVFGRLHQQSLGGSLMTRPVTPARPIPPPRQAGSPGAGPDDPVVVMPAHKAAHGYALPWAAHEPAKPAGEPAKPAAVSLDQAAIMRKLAESEMAATILTQIFDADPTPDADTMSTADTDRAHNLLLRALATQPSWSREEFAALAAQHGVLPDGAIDLLNELAIDAVGAPVVFDDVTLTVDHDVLLELLA